MTNHLVVACLLCGPASGRGGGVCDAATGGARPSGVGGEGHSGRCSDRAGTKHEAKVSEEKKAKSNPCSMLGGDGAKDER